MPLAPGDVFAGYTVLRQLGSGGMGAVYLVRHPRLPRLDALKLLRPELSIDPDFAARFLHEADVVARLSHRNIDVSFSPDGSTLVSRATDGSGGAALFTLAADGSGAPVQLTDGGTADDGDAVWSPDGTRIAFKSDRAGPSERGGNHVWVISADGTDPRQLPPGEEGVDDSAPAWGPR